MNNAKQTCVAAESDAARSHAASAAADSADYQREVAALRLRSQRRLHTDQLITKISTVDTGFSQRVNDYREEMQRDASDPFPCSTRTIKMTRARRC